MSMAICRLDHSCPGSLASQLADNICRAIAAGDFKPGDRLPSIARMAELCGTSVRVPRDAVRMLENEGVLRGRPRSGLVVLGGRRFVWRGSVLFVSYGRQSYYYRGMIFKNIAMRLSEEGWRVDFVNVLNGERDAEEQALPLRRALQGGHRLVVGAHLDAATVSEIRNANVPYFAIAGSVGDLNGDAVGFVSLSESRAMVELAKLCSERGVKRALRMAIDDTDQMFEIPFGERGIATECMAVRPDTSVNRFENSAGLIYRRLCDRLAAPRKPKVDLVYFADDSFAAAGLWAIHRAGLRIPDQMRVVTLSNRGNRPFSPFPVAYVEQDLVACAEDLSLRMLAFLEGRRFSRRMTCPARLIVGKGF